MTIQVNQLAGTMVVEIVRPTALDPAFRDYLLDIRGEAAASAQAAEGALNELLSLPVVVGPGASVNGEVALFSGTTGKQIKASSGSAATSFGLARLSDASASTARTALEIVKGTAAGDIPVLDESGKLDTDVLPETSQGDAEAGTGTTGRMSARRTKQLLFALIEAALSNWEASLPATPTGLTVGQWWSNDGQPTVVKSL